MQLTASPEAIQAAHVQAERDAQHIITMQTQQAEAQVQARIVELQQHQQPAGPPDCPAYAAPPPPRGRRPHGGGRRPSDFGASVERVTDQVAHTSLNDHPVRWVALAAVSLAPVSLARSSSQLRSFCPHPLSVFLSRSFHRSQPTP